MLPLVNACALSHISFLTYPCTPQIHRSVSTLLDNIGQSLLHSTIHRMYQHMCEFYHDADMPVLAEHKSRLYYWITFKPCIQLLYVPTTPSAAYDCSSIELKNYFGHFCPENQCSENYASILPELQHMAIRTVLSSLLLDFSDHRSSIILLCYNYDRTLSDPIYYHLTILCSQQSPWRSSNGCAVPQELRVHQAIVPSGPGQSCPSEDLLQSLSSP